jgi:hypothetical protein
MKHDREKLAEEALRLSYERLDRARADLRRSQESARRAAAITGWLERMLDKAQHSRWVVPVLLTLGVCVVVRVAFLIAETLVFLVGKLLGM